jgi:hypothetical protein
MVSESSAGRKKRGDQRHARVKRRKFITPSQVCLEIVSLCCTDLDDRLAGLSEHQTVRLTLPCFTSIKTT